MRNAPAQGARGGQAPFSGADHEPVADQQQRPDQRRDRGPSAIAQQVVQALARETGGMPPRHFLPAEPTEPDAAQQASRHGGAEQQGQVRTVQPRDGQWKKLELVVRTAEAIWGGVDQ